MSVVVKIAVVEPSVIIQPGFLGGFFVAAGQERFEMQADALYCVAERIDRQLCTTAV